tara:strand:- start:8269 stop:9789 length:1521 start_codon:yes stop_codon:yes gene_type:complete
MADSQLIQGAKDVAQAKNTGRLAAAEGATKVGAYLAEGIGDLVQKRNKKFNELMEAELEAQGKGLSDKEYQELVRRLQKKRAGYVYLNKRGRVQAEKDLEEEGDKIIEDKKDKDEVCETCVDDCEDLPQNVKDCVEKCCDEENKETDENGDIIYRVDFAIQNNADEVFLYDEDGNPKYLDKDGDHRLATYREAWNDPAVFRVSEDGKWKYSKYHKYPNTPDGFKKYEAKSEAWYQEQLIGKNPETTDDLTTMEEEGDNPLRGILMPGGKGDDYITSPEKEKFMTQDELDLANSPNKMLSPMKMVSPFRKQQEQPSASGQDTKKKSSKVTGDGKYMTMKDIKKLVDKHKIDRDSQNKIRTIIEKEVSNADAFVAGDERKSFNREAVKMNFMNNVLNSESANLSSLATHKHWGATSWKQDLTEALVKGNYEDLGITTQQAKSQDPTPKTPITGRDAVLIVQGIMKNQKLLKETLAEYYTQYAENNYNAKVGNVSKTKRQVKDDENEFA